MATRPLIAHGPLAALHAAFDELSHKIPLPQPWRLLAELACAALLLALVLGLVPTAGVSGNARTVGDVNLSAERAASDDGAVDLAWSPAPPAQAATEVLRLAGTLFIDPNRMVRVHARFSGQVVSIGTFSTADSADDQAASSAAQARTLQVGDRVRRGQLLAVVWSREVGEKKSDLIAAACQLAADRAQFERLQGLEPGIVPQRAVFESRRQCEADQIALERAERTLRSWHVADEEMAELYAEVARIGSGGAAVESGLGHWAEFDIRAPLDGTVLEQNIALGDLVDTRTDLFKIADLSTLGVLAHVYEEDLARLEAAAAEDRHWSIRLSSQPTAPALAGQFELISHSIDPRQHTAAVLGWLPNPTAGLRAGQFITAEIRVRAPPRGDE